MTYTYVGLVDTSIPATEEMEKQRLMSKFCPELGQYYTVHFHIDSLDKHQYLLETILDQFRREDNEYSYKGFLMSRTQLVTKVIARYAALVLECVEMKTVPVSHTVCKFTEEES